MKRTTRKKKGMVADQDIFKQVLSEDYWEGYYVLTDGNIIRCEDSGTDALLYKIYSMKNGNMLSNGEFGFRETTLFSEFVTHISSIIDSRIYLRISDACLNPDRHEEIDSIFEHPDRFELIRIQNLVKHLKNRGINIFGGKMGGLELADGGCNGFYLMGGGRILFCKDLSNWEDGRVNKIVDGVISFRILTPDSFGYGSSSENYFGYLRGDRFSSFMEEITKGKDRISSILALEGEELYALLLGALNGDRESAAIASHRLHFNIQLAG